METKLHSLPPMKRFRLLHQEKQQKQESESNLPAKKRKQSRKTPDFSQVIAPITPPTTFSLPAKKRIWAIRPDFSPTKSPPSSLSFDLNVEYTPSPRKSGRETSNNNTHCESPLSSFTSASRETDSQTPTKDSSENEVFQKEERETSINTQCESGLTDLNSASRETDSLPPTKTSSENGVFQKDERETSINTQCESGLTDLNSASREIDFQTPTKKPSKNGAFRKEERETELETPNPDVSTQEEEEEREEEEDDDDGILCAICESTDGDPKDPIVFCDGCDLMVHASCYGNPLVNDIPEGDWFCAKCSVSKSSVSPEKCCLCPVLGGAMKPTTNGKWAHIICALLVPEVFFEDPEGREGINCEEVPKKRWRENCYVCCSGRKGCVVECSEPKCELAFHVTCGLKEDLCIELKEGKSSGGIVVAFCKDHTELWKKQQQTGKFKIVAREEHKH